MRLTGLLQLAVLRVLAKIKPAWKRVPLFRPFGWLNCGGRLPLVSYKEIYVDEIYSPPVLLPSTARIVDVGAHLGLATLYFAGRYPNARIDSYEANPNAGPLLEMNISGLYNATAHCVAVGDAEG